MEIIYLLQHSLTLLHITDFSIYAELFDVRSLQTEFRQNLRTTHNIQGYLLPEDGILFITTHRQSVTLEAQVHRCVMVPDIWHVLQEVKRKVKGFSN